MKKFKAINENRRVSDKSLVKKVWNKMPLFACHIQIAWFAIDFTLILRILIVYPLHSPFHKTISIAHARNVFIRLGNLFQCEHFGMHSQTIIYASSKFVWSCIWESNAKRKSRERERKTKAKNHIQIHSCRTKFLVLLTGFPNNFQIISMSRPKPCDSCERRRWKKKPSNNWILCIIAYIERLGIYNNI